MALPLHCAPEAERSAGGVVADRPLRLVFWESTAACNLACVYCRRQDVLGASHPDELTTADACGLIDQLAVWVPRPPVLVFSGGEPLTRPDLFELLDYARSLGVPTAVASNGTAIDAAVAMQLRRAGVHRVSVSLDGADARTHDAARGIPGSFAAALAGVRALVDAGVQAQINCTITASNVHQLPDVLTLTRTLGCVALHVFVLVPVGCGVELAETQRLGQQQTEDVLNWCAEQSERDGFEIRPTCAPQYQRIVAQRARRRGEAVRLPRHASGCLAAEGIAFISHVGEVYPCGYLPLVCGQIREQSLAEIWDASPVYAQLRDRAGYTGACAGCGWRQACGGCRARAYGSHGDVLGNEPSCVLTPTPG